MRREDTVVELWRRTEEHDVRLLSNIKAPTFQKKDGEEEAEEEPEVEMNEVTVCVTKLGGSHTMAIHMIVANNTSEIARINFTSNYEHAKEHRLDQLASNEYNGPYVETLPREMF